MKPHFFWLCNIFAYFSRFICILLDISPIYAYNKEDVDVFTITAPESVSGVSGRIAGDSEATLALQYDDLVLDDARPVRPGMTPADAVFGVVCALRDTPADESWRESADGTALTVLHYRSESGDETIEKLVWLREDNMQPVYAELFADGTRELSIRFTSYQENGG